VKRQLKRLLGAILPPAVLGSVAHLFLGALPPAPRKRWLRIYNGADLRWSLETLVELGFRPRAIVDAGAFLGEFSLLAREHFPEAAVVMLEARPAQRAALERAAARMGGDAAVAIALLGAERRESMAFHDIEGGSGSSVMREIGDVPGAVVHLPMTTLDDAVAAVPIARAVAAPLLLKLDVQGYEREVLLGGARTLEAAEVVVMELSLQRCNEGAPLAHELVAFMAERGFRLFDLTGFWRHAATDVLMQVDVVFVRGTSRLASVVEPNH
jgi:FkbM family methyltransferase